MRAPFIGILRNALVLTRRFGAFLAATFFTAFFFTIFFAVAFLATAFFAVLFFATFFFATFFFAGAAFLALAEALRKFAFSDLISAFNPFVACATARAT